MIGRTLMALGLLAMASGAALSQPAQGDAQQQPKRRLSRADLPLAPRILQLSLRVADMEKADKFYTQVLGMERGTQYRPAPGILESFYNFPGQDRSATSISLFSAPASMPGEIASGKMTTPVSFNLTVRDVKSIVAKVEAAGGKILRPTVTQKAGDFTQDMAFIADPDNHVIELTYFY